MAIQVNIFEAGSVPTAQELVTLINELNTTLDESVTITGEQSITGVKTFLGSKVIKFKQTTKSDKLGFTLYDPNNKEIGYLEYYNDGRRILALGNYYKSPDNGIETEIGFQISNKVQGASYRILAPLGNKAKQNLPLTGDYTDLYLPLVFVNGAQSVTADDTGKVDLSSLIGSGSGDISGLATVATTGDYNDLDNRPAIPVVDITKAQADGWYQPKGNYALKSELFSGSYNDLTDKPSLFSGNYNDLTNKPTLFSGSYNDLSDKPTIPTVPTISTNITSDATSDTKTASPKAVKDFVEGKGYLTQHQDISGKADQTDLEALEDRVEALEQGDSDSTDEDKSVKLVKDPVNYLKASVGDIIKYNGPTTSDFTHGHDYECTKKGNVAYSVSSGDYVLDVAQDATNEEFIAAMANEVKPFKYSERIALDDYTEYCAVTNPHLILGKSTKSKADLVVGDVLVSLPDMTPISVITAVSGSTVTAKLLSTGYEFDIKNSGGQMIGDAYIFTNPEDVKAIITDGDFLMTMEPEPYPPSSTLNYLNKYVAIVGKGYYSGTGTNITITKYYQSAEVAGTPSEWVEAKPCDCSDGGDTTQYSYLKLIPDLDAYTEAPIGEIVKYIGPSNGQYTRGWDYEKVNSEPIIHTGDSYIEITSIESATRNNKLTVGSKLINTGTVIKRLTAESSGYDIYIGDDDPEVGDYVYLYNSDLTPAYDFGIINTVTRGTNNWTIRYTSDAHPTWGPTMQLPLSASYAVEFTIWIDAESGERYAGTPPSGSKNFTHFYCLEDGSHVGMYTSNKTATEDIGGTVSWQPIIHPTASVNSGD